MVSSETPQEKFKPQGGEQRLIDALRAGEACVFVHEGEDKKPNAERTIRGDILGQILRSEILEGEDIAIHLPRAIEIEGACITGVLDMSDSNTGLVLRIVKSKFDSQLYFPRAKLALLSLDRSETVGADFGFLETTSHLWVDGLLNKGKFDFDYANIGGQFAAEDAEFLNIDGKAIYAQCAKVSGGVFLNNSKVEGSADFKSAKIEGQFSADNASFIGLDQDALNFQGAIINGFFSITDMPHPAIGTIDLTNAKFGSVLLDDHSLPLGQLHLDGTRYDNLYSQGGNAHTVCAGWLRPVSIRSRKESLKSLEKDYEVYQKVVMQERFGNIEFSDLPLKVKQSLQNLKNKTLRAQSDFSTPAGYWPAFAALSEAIAKDGVFVLDKATLATKVKIALDKSILEQTARPRSPFAFRQFSKVLDANGHESEARAVRVLAGRAYTSRHVKRMNIFAKIPYRVMRWTLRSMTGYGAKPWRVLNWLMVSWFIGTAVFTYASLAEEMTPARERVYMSLIENDKSLKDIPEGYPKFSPWIYSLDVILPVVDIAQESHWRPKAKARWQERGLLYFNRFLILLGWIMTTIGIAGFSGLLSDKREP